MKKKTKVLISVLLGLAMLIIMAAVYIFSGIRYPQIAGDYDTGRTFISICDTSREEIFTDDPNDTRELALTVYYPAEIKPSDQKAKYADGALKTAIAAANGYPAFFPDLIKINSFDEPAVSNKQSIYPVLLYSTGLFGQMPFSGSLLERIAATGYIIICISHPYSDAYTVYPDGRIVYANEKGTGNYSTGTNAELEESLGEVVEMKAQDICFVYKALKNFNDVHPILSGRLDLVNVGAFGHSAGGAATIAAMQQEPGIKAGINMDGSLYKKQREARLSQPVMFMMAQANAILYAMNPKEKLSIHESSSDSYLMMLENTGHVSFITDSILFAEKYPFLSDPGEIGTIGSAQAISCIGDYTVAFFDKYLKNKDSKLLTTWPLEEYPGVWFRNYEWDGWSAHK